MVGMCQAASASFSFLSTLCKAQFSYPWGLRANVSGTNQITQSELIVYPFKRFYAVIDHCGMTKHCRSL